MTASSFECQTWPCAYEGKYCMANKSDDLANALLSPTSGRSQTARWGFLLALAPVFRIPAFHNEVKVTVTCHRQNEMKYKRSSL